jgi:arylsulfatase A-like enzyme
MRAVVFVLRGCPAGWLGAYGNEWVATPNLDRIAAEAVVFDRHISDRPDGAAASAAWLGGPQAPVLASFKAANIQTVLVRANHPDTDLPDWFYAGWSEVFDTRPRDEDESPLQALMRELPALLERLASTRDYLLWIEIDRLLPPWDVGQEIFDAYMENDEVDEADKPAERAIEKPDTIPPWYDPATGLFDSRDLDACLWLHASFAAVVTALDAELGVLFDVLPTHGLDNDAAWVVTSDYGYPLGEHGQIGIHRPWLHEELVHLPLVVRLPGGVQAGRRVGSLTQPPDLADMLSELFNLKSKGESALLALSRGEAVTPREFAISALEANGAAEAAIRSKEWAYLLPLKVPDGENREALLFAQPDDRWEVNDLHRVNLEIAEEMEEMLRKQIQE